MEAMATYCYDGIWEVTLPCCGHKIRTRNLTPRVPSSCPNCKKQFVHLVIRKQEDVKRLNIGI